MFALQFTKGDFPVKKLFEDFKKFAFKGNVLDMAVGVMIASAFGKIVTSLVNDMFMPLVSLVTGGVDIKNLFAVLGEGTFETVEAAKEAGVATLNYGMFLQNIIDFLLIAVCVFIFVKVVNGLKKKEPEPAPAPAPRLCPFCRQEVAADATKCHHCTSDLPAEEK